MFVIRIISFDQLRNQQGLVQVERDLAAGHAHFHIPIVGQKALQFRDRLGRNNDVRFVTARKFQLDVEHGQPPSIGGHEGEFVFFETEQDAVQDVARFIGRDGVGGFA